MGSGTEVVLFSEVKNVLSLWEVEISGITPSPLLSKEVVLFFGGSTISKADQGFIQDFSVGGELFFFIAGETMWLIDYSEGEGVGGGCAPSHAACSAETYSF